MALIKISVSFLYGRLFSLSQAHFRCFFSLIYYLCVHMRMHTHITCTHVEAIEQHKSWFSPASRWFCRWCSGSTCWQERSRAERLCQLHIPVFLCFITFCPTEWFSLFLCSDHPDCPGFSRQSTARLPFMGEKTLTLAFLFLACKACVIRVSSPFNCLGVIIRFREQLYA